MKFIPITMKWVIYLSMMPFLIISSCRSDKTANIPDVSDIHVDTRVTRFEQLLLGDTTMDAVKLQKLMDEYPGFSKVFFEHVMPKEDNIQINTDRESRLQDILRWTREPSTRWLYDTVQQIIPKLDKVEKDLQSAFTFAKYYFPDKKTPRLYTTISDFGYFPFIYSEDSLTDGLGISLEMFLGDSFPYMKYTGMNNAFSDYLTRSYNKDHIVSRTLSVWVDDLVGPPPGERLLDHMINNGKKLYILKSLLPETHDSVIIEYPSEKLQWAEDNERNIYYQLTTQDMLYETSMRKIQKFIGPSPSSPGMPPQSPGNTGSWLGWQIVKAYMKKHPETTLPQLIAIKDSQMILDQSGYRPPR
ncbi:MAG TPA: hypothetical protein VFG10_11725 [Saprospiraceae bacterium]|nr:hypothetical protein [Saprospiraceae bacterium]